MIFRPQRGDDHRFTKQVAFRRRALYQYCYASSLQILCLCEVSAVLPLPRLV
jgi:hypothetical protein